MDLGLEGGVALVTGGGNGIGRATARALAAEGASVVVADVNVGWANAVAEELVKSGATASAVEMDVSIEGSVQRAVHAAVSMRGHLDYLVLCAGISGLAGKTIEEIEVDQWDRLFGVNVRGQWLPVKHSLPHLRLSSRASVTIVASDSAIVASPLHVPYCTSKGALLMLTKAMAVDFRSQGVRVNCVCPSVVNTRQPKNDMGLADDATLTGDYPVHQPEDIARYLVLLASPATATINGHALAGRLRLQRPVDLPGLRVTPRASPSAVM